MSEYEKLLAKIQKRQREGWKFSEGPLPISYQFLKRFYDEMEKPPPAKNVLGFEKLRVKKDTAGKRWQVLGATKEGALVDLLSIPWRILFDNSEIQKRDNFRDWMSALAACVTFAPLSKEDEEALRKAYPALPTRKVRLQKKVWEEAPKEEKSRKVQPLDLSSKRKISLE